jgi:hypothetical protein
MLHAGHCALSFLLKQWRYTFSGTCPELSWKILLASALLIFVLLISLMNLRDGRVGLKCLNLAYWGAIHFYFYFGISTVSTYLLTTLYKHRTTCCTLLDPKGVSSGLNTVFPDLVTLLAPDHFPSQSPAAQPPPSTNHYTSTYTLPGSLMNSQYMRAPFQLLLNHLSFWHLDITSCQSLGMCSCNVAVRARQLSHYVGKRD